MILEITHSNRDIKSYINIKGLKDADLVYDKLIEIREEK